MSSRRAQVEIYKQAGEYFDALPERERPQYILVSDFQTFDLYDLDERARVSFSLANLHQHVESFGFIVGVQHRKFRDQDPANFTAAELVGRLHDLLHEAGYRGHDLERFLVRIVFCHFADDTGISEPRDIFLELVETRTRDDDLDTVFAPELEGLDRDEIRRWYNGYNWLGEHRLYNPWDILFVLKNRQFKSYWFESGNHPRSF